LGSAPLNRPGRRAGHGPGTTPRPRRGPDPGLRTPGGSIATHGQQRRAPGTVPERSARERTVTGRTQASAPDRNLDLRDGFDRTPATPPAAVREARPGPGASAGSASLGRVRQRSPALPCRGDRAGRLPHGRQPRPGPPAVAGAALPWQSNGSREPRSPGVVEAAQRSPVFISIEIEAIGKAIRQWNYRH
jgi:hypothetical protein